MEDREMPRMSKYGESKTTWIMMATVPHVNSGLGRRKFQADGFLFDRVNKHQYVKNTVKLALLQAFLRNFHTAKKLLETNVNTNPGFYNINKVWRRLDFFPKESSIMANLTENPSQVKLTDIKRYGYLTITMTNLW